MSEEVACLWKEVRVLLQLNLLTMQLKTDITGATVWANTELGLNELSIEYKANQSEAK